MLGFLLLPPCWVFFMSASIAGAFTELGFCCAWPLPHKGWADVISARLNLRNSTVDVGGVCHFLGWPCCSKNLRRWTDQCYSSVLFGKQRKIHPRGLSVGQPKDAKRRVRLNFGSSFYMLFFSSCLSLPYINWASEERRASSEGLTAVFGPSFVLFSWAFSFFVF